MSRLSLYWLCETWRATGQYHPRGSGWLSAKGACNEHKRATRYCVVVLTCCGNQESYPLLVRRSDLFGNKESHSLPRGGTVGLAS
jgi:hypothetical protein